MADPIVINVKAYNVCDGVMKVTLVMTDLKIKIYQNADLVVNN